MDLRQLAALVAIADHGSFSAAARALFTVQSNVSTHIARLERELGTTLVERQSGTLTDAGVAVVDRARRVLRELDDIVADVSAESDEITGVSRLGVIGTTARWLVPQLLAALAATHPRARAVIHDGSTSTLIPSVVGRALDAAVVHLPVEDPELEVEPLFAEDLVLLVHRRHPLADREEVLLPELGDHPLLLPAAGTALRRAIDRAAANQGVTLSAHAEIDGVRLLTSLAFDGFGPSIVPATAIPGWLSGDFRRIAVPGLPRRVVGWVQRRRPRPNAPTRALLELTRKLIGDVGSLQPGVHTDGETIPLRSTERAR
jgi:LysR family hydrogen peroxide-inducible transcriptional activator